MWGIVASLIYLPIPLSGIIFFAHPLPGYEGIVLVPGIAGLVTFVNGPARKQDRGNVTAERTQKMDTFMSGLSTLRRFRSEASGMPVIHQQARVVSRRSANWRSAQFENAWILYRYNPTKPRPRR